MFPFVVTYPQSGTISRESLWLNGNHSLVTEIHVARVDLPRDVAEVIPYLRLLTTALWDDPNLDGTIVNFPFITYTFGPLKWGDIDTIGFRLLTDITTSTPLSNTVSITSGADAPTLLETMIAIQKVMPDVVRQSPDTPVEAASMFPLSIVFPAGGRIVRSFDWTKELHTLNAEIHIQRNDLARNSAIAYSTLRDFVEALYNDPTLDYNVTSVNEVRYSYGQMDWGEVPTLGFRFEIDTKVVL